MGVDTLVETKNIRVSEIVIVPEKPFEGGFDPRIEISDAEAAKIQGELAYRRNFVTDGSTPQNLRKWRGYFFLWSAVAVVFRDGRIPVETNEYELGEMIRSTNLDTSIPYLRREVALDLIRFGLALGEQKKQVSLPPDMEQLFLRESKVAIQEDDWQKYFDFGIATALFYPNKRSEYTLDADLRKHVVDETLEIREKNGNMLGLLDYATSLILLFPDMKDGLRLDTSFWERARKSLDEYRSLEIPSDIANFMDIAMKLTILGAQSAIIDSHGDFVLSNRALDTYTTKDTPLPEKRGF